MAFYTVAQLEKDFFSVVSQYQDIQSNALNYIRDNELFSADRKCLEILKNHDFNWLIEPMQAFSKDRIDFYPFIEIKQRIYWITLPLYMCGQPRASIAHGLCDRLGGMMCTYDDIAAGGRTLISESTSWSAFEYYLPEKNTKQVIQSIVARIPYTYTSATEEDIKKQKKICC